MEAKVSIIMGSISDLEIMQDAITFLEEFNIPFEVNALSAHRTPELVMSLAKDAFSNGVRVIIAGAGGAAHLPGVLAAFTTLPVVGVPIKSTNSIDGWDSVLSILQMPAGIPVATVALNGSRNAAILAAQILGTSDSKIQDKLIDFKQTMKEKVIKSNEDLKVKLKKI